MSDNPPSQYELFKQQGEEALDNGNFEKAIAIYQQAIEAEPENPDPYVDLGNVYRISARLDEAEYWHRQALTIDPDYWRPHHNLGDIKIGRGQFEESIPYLKKALETSPESYVSLVCLGHAYSVLKRHQDAVKCLEKAIGINPSGFLANFQLAGDYARQKQWDNTSVGLKNQSGQEFSRKAKRRFVNQRLESAEGGYYLAGDAA